MDEMPGYVIEYLAKAIAFLKDAPEDGAGLNAPTGSVHFYLGDVRVICEGEHIGTLVNEDPEWVYRPVTT